ncbi:UDP-N-acetylmuramate dehydrogenase [Kocuria varians]|nr:UDP-N-acetylmuramate dehydrogenase [Kocuria varians]
MNALRLSELTTTAVGGPAAKVVRAETEEELLAAVTAADDAGEHVLLVGGGSNILASDAPYEGTVVHVASRGVVVAEAEDGAVLVEVAAGHPWDDAVRETVARGLAGLETLAGIPGTAGATPVQNVGAYGAEVSQTIESVRTWDRTERRECTFTAGELAFSYRDSALKRSMTAGSPRHVVLAVTFRLLRQEESLPVRYAQLATALGVEVGETAPAALVRETVLRLRASKGMVLDPADRDTCSTGSFFTNPVVSHEELTDRIPADAPRYPVLDARGHELPGAVKFSAAWLIDHAGFGKGFGLPGTRNELLDLDGESVAGGRASLSTKHTLAMTNRGGASGEDVAAVARTVQRGVAEVSGVVLVPEPVLVGLSL